MLIIPIKPGEHIDRALKRYKQKVRRTKQVDKLRSAQYFTKPSQEKREQLAKAKHKEAYERAQEQ